MKVLITNLFNQAGTQGIAQQNVAKIGRELGFQEIDIFKYDINVDDDHAMGCRLDGVIAAVQSNDIVIIQTPTWNGLRYPRRLVNKIKAYSNTKIIIMIHDVVSLAFNSPEERLRETINIYNKADLLIVPSQKMYDILCEHGLQVKKYMIQKLFDYPVSNELPTPSFHKKMIFTGAPPRFPFLLDWHYETPLDLYTGEPYDPTGKNVTVFPYMKDMQLLSNLAQGGFGLVWPSSEANNYYDLLLPYKIGTFLAAGIPLIIKKGLAAEKLLIDNQVAFAVDSLDEADSLIQNISADEYNTLSKRIQEFNFLIKNGYFTKKLLLDAVFSVLFQDN
ncbi:beta-1,6-galactofuranosyltransferase [Butyrivibrio sp. NC2007]|uniref:beta-1,6-galactofuranosyltransferase n=1 Tax=Butyrivibrio sp. NC2007 TaxID=1280683 RepID=UPI0003B48515|nr:beta-1,6-galactofuranosyltransferase [Butyrivibrio sp. NC2007]